MTILKKIKELFKTKTAFYVIFILYLISLLINSSMLIIDYKIIDSLDKMLRYICYLLFFIRFIINIDLDNIRSILSCFKHNKKIAILIIVFILSSVLNFIFTGEKDIIIFTIIMISSYDVSFDKIVDITSNTQLFFTVFIVFLTVFNFVTNYTTMRADGSLRNSLGFMYSAHFFQYILYSIVLHMYIKRLRVDLYEIFIFQFIFLIMYFITDSRTELIFGELLVIILILKKLNILKIFKNMIIILEKIFIYVFPLFPIVSLLLGYLYDYSSVIVKLNTLLTNRIIHVNWALKKYGIRLFGSKTEFIGNGAVDVIKYGPGKSNYIDNDYMRILFQYGVIILSCFMIFMFITLICLYDQKKYYEVALCIFCLMFGLINARLIYLQYCPIGFLIIPNLINYLKSQKEIIEI